MHHWLRGYECLCE